MIPLLELTRMNCLLSLGLLVTRVGNLFLSSEFMSLVPPMVYKVFGNRPLFMNTLTPVMVSLRFP